MSPVGLLGLRQISNLYCERLRCWKHALAFSRKSTLLLGGGANGVSRRPEHCAEIVAVCEEATSPFPLIRGTDKQQK
jgi:hypothetical protein